MAGTSRLFLDSNLSHLIDIIVGSPSMAPFTSDSVVPTIDAKARSHILVSLLRYVDRYLRLTILQERSSPVRERWQKEKRRRFSRKWVTAGF
jgi:hypothetical protein